MWMQNLMNTDPDSVRVRVNEITKLILNNISKAKKTFIFKSEPKPLEIN